MAKLDKMRITWLSVNASYAHSSFALPGIHAASSSRLPGAAWNHVTATIKDAEWGVVSRLLTSRPQVLASTLYLFNRAYTLAALKRFALLSPDTVIILGGPEFLGDNRPFIEAHPFVRAVFRGEGDLGFADLLNYLPGVTGADSGNARLREGIDGLCWIDSAGHYQDHGLAVVPEPLDRLPSPLTSMFYETGKAFGTLETNRGCPAACAFCTSCRLGPPRYFSLNRVRHDLERLRLAGVTEVRILDRTFNLPAERCLRLLELFARYATDMGFHIEVNPASLTPEVSKKLQAFPPAKLHIEAGLQTGNPEALRAIWRSPDIEPAWAGIEALCESSNLTVHVDLIAGLPKTSLNDIHRDLQRLAILGADEIQLELLKLLPGTPLREKASGHGILFNPEPPYEVLQTPQMAFNDLNEIRLLSRAVDNFYNDPGLRDAVRAAVNISPDFFAEITRLGADKRSEPMPISRTRRFRLLHKHCLDLPAVRTLIEFKWMAEGLGVKNGLGQTRLWKETIPEDAACIHGKPDAAAAPCRIWFCEIGGQKHWFIYTRKSQEKKAVAVFKKP